MPEGDPTPPAPTPTPAPGDGGKTFTQEELDRIVGERVQRERSKYTDYDAIKQKASKFDELDQANKSDVERVTGERDQFKTQAETAAAESLRLRVALEKKLPAELIDRLKGATKEDLEKDADELLKLVKPGTSFDGGPRGDNTPPPADMDAAIRAAAGRT
jgi:hypothetical protein